MPLLIRARLAGPKQSQILAMNEIDNLPDARKFFGSDAIVLVGSASAANSFLLSPRAIEYSFAHQPEPSQIADARKMIVSQRRRATPAPSAAPPRCRARIEIEEDVLPAFRGEPVAQGDRLEIVLARIT